MKELQNHVCHNYWHPEFNILYKPIIQQESSPVSNKVGEYRERNLRTFLFYRISAESMVLSCALSSSAQPTGLGQGSEMAEAWFCVQLTIFLLIWMYVLDYCPAGRSNDHSFLVSWQGQPHSDYFLEFIMPCILTRFRGPLEGKPPNNIIEPPPPPYLQYQESVLIKGTVLFIRRLHSTVLVTFSIGILVFRLVVKAQFLVHLTI